MGVLEFIIWMYGITWAGVVLGIAVSRKREDGQ